VLPAMAETTTATSWPASTSRLTWRATLRMRSISATDVPPNFITRRAMSGEGPREKRLSFSEGVQGLQPAVISGAPRSGEPGIHVLRPGESAQTSRYMIVCGYGFRAPAYGRPRNDDQMRLRRFPDLRQMLRDQPQVL